MWLSPAITENQCQGLIFASVIDTGEQVIAGVMDTGDKHSFENISANFRKNLKRSQGNTHGRGTLIHEKTLRRKSRVRLPLNTNLQDN
jgi:hypothetical protein